MSYATKVLNADTLNGVVDQISAEITAKCPWASVVSSGAGTVTLDIGGGHYIRIWNTGSQISAEIRNKANKAAISGLLLPGFGINYTMYTVYGSKALSIGLGGTGEISRICVLTLDDGSRRLIARKSADAQHWIINPDGDTLLQIPTVFTNPTSFVAGGTDRFITPAYFVNSEGKLQSFDSCLYCGYTAVNGIHLDGSGNAYDAISSSTNRLLVKG